MSNPYIGTICAYGCNFAPRNWAQCNGQIIPIQQNAALFSILGTTFGGNGTTTFALPNLQGRIPMHWGSGAGGPATQIGEVQGETSVTLLPTQMPAHTHQAYAAIPGNASERTAAPQTNGTSYLSTSSAPNSVYQTAPTPNTPFAPNAISVTGNSQPHENMQPYLVLNICIAQYGAFPSRN